MNLISRRAVLKHGGLGVLSIAGGCSMQRPASPTTAPAEPPHTFGYHPFENGIPAKGHSMTYLVVSDGAAVIVDPGRGTYHDEMIAFVRSHGLEPRAVKWALLTHCHVDHTGGAHLVQAEGIPVACSKFTAWAVREASIDMGNKEGPRPEMACKVDRIMNDGDVLNVGAMRVRIIGTPGHTAGCLTYLVDTDEGRTLFTGDLIRNTGQPGWTGSPSFSLEESINSIEKLLALKPDKAYWGHGDIDEPAQAWLQRCLDLYKKGRWIMD